MYKYCLYGAEIDVDFPLFDASVSGAMSEQKGHQSVRLVELPAKENLPAPAVRHQFYQAHGRSLYLLSDRPDESISKGQMWQLTVEDVLSFSFVSGEPQVYYRLHELGTRGLLIFWFVHTFLPMYLSVERGCDFIHAAAVEVNERPVLFVAPSAGGKSTLADYFLGQGHPMLADDKLAVFELGERFSAAPSHPYHRPFRKFEVLGQPIEHFAIETKPVHAIYALERGGAESVTEITETRGLRKFQQLMPHYLFHFPYLQQRRTGWMAGLADQCPVFSVRRPWNLDRMHEVYQAICAHSRELAIN